MKNWETQPCCAVCAIGLNHVTRYIKKSFYRERFISRCQTILFDKNYLFDQIHKMVRNCTKICSIYI